MDLYCGDCLDVMPRLRGVDAVITDLPYGTTQAPWDGAVDMDRLWTAVKLLDPAVFITTAMQPFSAALIMSNLAWFRYEIIWEKSKASGFLNAKRRPLSAHESILVFAPRRAPYNPQMTAGEPYDKGVRKEQTDGDAYGRFDAVEVKSAGGRYPRSVQYFKTAEREGGLHKAQKPVALLEWIIRTFTDPGAVVLDPCMGSGTTGVACINTGRLFIGIERDKRIFAVASRRLTERQQADNWLRCPSTH